MCQDTWLIQSQQLPQNKLNLATALTTMETKIEIRKMPYPLYYIPKKGARQMLEIRRTHWFKNYKTLLRIIHPHLGLVQMVISKMYNYIFSYDIAHCLQNIIQWFVLSYITHNYYLCDHHQSIRPNPSSFTHPIICIADGDSSS